MNKALNSFAKAAFHGICLHILSAFYYLLELVYRFALLLFHAPEKLNQIIVYSPCPWTFDSNMGFNYTKKNYYAFTITKQKNGAFRSDKTVFYTDQYGNMSIGKKRKDARKILILGDSFTVGVGDEPNKASWPDLMAGYSEFRDISILNYARDGVGILNMVDIAYHLCMGNKYEHILFTPYIGDFLRPKIWRHFVKPNDNRYLGRCDVGLTNSKKALLNNIADVAYVARSRYEDFSEEQLKKIFRDAENIASEYFPRRNTILNSHPLAFHRITEKTCKEYLKNKNNNDPLGNQISAKKYSMLPGFSEKCSFINSRAGRVSLILLPDFDTLSCLFKQGKQDSESISFLLMKELKELLSASLYRLADKYKVKDGKPDKYFRAHVADFHYSNLGLAWVAKNISKIINEK